MSKADNSGRKIDWTSIRLETVTADALAAYAARLQVAVRAAPWAYPPFLGDKRVVSMGSALLYLLWQQGNRSARGRRCRGGKRKPSKVTMDAVREADTHTADGIPGEGQGTPASPQPPHVEPAGSKAGSGDRGPLDG